MGSIFKSDAGKKAARRQNVYTQRAIDEQRRQFDITQNNINPFIEMGHSFAPDVAQAATMEGLDQRLSDIFGSDIFNTLVSERERAVNNQLSAGGLTRSGAGIQAAANIPTEIGLGLEELLSGRQNNLYGSAQNAAMGLGSLSQNNSNTISNLISGQGQAVASGVLADAQAKAQGWGNVIGIASMAATGGFGSGAKNFFSDPRLKENAEKVSEIGNLSLWEWDWIKEVKDSVVGQCPNIGFMADEVAEKYPHCVGEFGGFAVVCYGALLDELEAKYGVNSDVLCPEIGEEISQR